MSTTDKKYLDLAGLTQYDGKIKALINNQDVKKVALNASAYTIGTGVDAKEYAAGNVLLVWIGWGGATTSEAQATYLADESNATYAIPMGAASMEALIGSYDPTSSPLSPLKDRGWDSEGTAEEKAAHEHAHSTIVGYIGAVREEAAANLDYELGELDVDEFALGSKDSSTNVITLKGIKEVNGKVAAGTDTTKDITLAAVAATGAAADVTTAAIDDGESTPTTLKAASNVQALLTDIVRGMATSDVAKTLHIVESAGASGTDTLKSYAIYQGGEATVDDSTGKTTAVSGGTLVDTINIPKDYLVRDAEVKVVTAADKAEDGVFEDDDNFAEGDKYIDFVINTADGTGSGTAKHIYLNLNDLMAALSVEANAEEVQLDISATNQLSADVVDIAGTKITYKAATEAVLYTAEDQEVIDGEKEVGDVKVPASARESVTAALTRLDGADTVTGSVAKKIKDAVEALDTSSDVAVAAFSTTGSSTTAADVITLTGAVKEVNGVIEGVSDDNITLTTITEAEIDLLFA